MALLHDLLVTLLLAVVILPAAALAARPAMRPDKPGLLATACLIAALALGRGELWAVPGWMFLAPFAAADFMRMFVVIARAFRQVDRMAIFLHADFGMKGATLKGLENEIIAAIASLTLVLLPTYLIRNLWDFGPWFYGLAAVVLVALNPLVQYVVRRQFLPTIAGDIAQHLVPPCPMQVPDTLPDLIVIYLEGTHRRMGRRIHPQQSGDVSGQGTGAQRPSGFHDRRLSNVVALAGLCRWLGRRRSWAVAAGRGSNDGCNLWRQTG